MSFLKSASFQKRALSSVVLAPVVLFIIWYGQWPLILFLAGAFSLALYEWVLLVKGLCCAKLYILAGGVYMALGFYSFYLLWGFNPQLPIFLLLLVWASDIGAYFFGKFVGGPKLVPRISPNKTWAGLVGAALSPVLVISAYLIFSGTTREFGLAIAFASILGLTAQVGDLLVSYMKRKAGAKDTGDLIPGHGGLLDRIDSLLLVAPVSFVLVSYLATFP